MVWKKMRKKSVVSHVMKRDNVFYYVWYVPKDLIVHYSLKWLCFSLFAWMIYGKDKNGKHLKYKIKNYSNIIFYAVLIV